MKTDQKGGLIRRFREAVESLEIPEELLGQPTVTLEGDKSAWMTGSRSRQRAA